MDLKLKTRFHVSIFLVFFPKHAVQVLNVVHVLQVLQLNALELLLELLDFALHL